jgi:hypothetical protein
MDVDCIIRRQCRRLGSMVGASALLIAALTFDVAARNLAEQQPEIVKRLSDAYVAWAERCGVVEWETLLQR